MSFFFEIKKRLKNIIFSFLKKKWIILDDINNRALEDFKENIYIKPNLNNKVFLETKNKLSKGWYIFGILQLSENKNCITRIKTTDFFFQSRPTFPSRRRWRVFRNAYTSNLKIEIKQVQSSIKIAEIWVLKIPSFFAWYKIYRKIYNISSKIYVKSFKRKFLWKKYNDLFNKQVKKHKCFYYEDWIKYVEPKLIQNLIKKNKILEDWKFYQEISENNLEKTNFIIIHRAGVKFSPYLDNIISWLNQKNNKGNLYYGDEDHLSKKGYRFKPIFKSAWNRELFWTDKFYSSHWIISIDLWKEIFQDDNDFKFLDFDELVFKIFTYLIKNNKEKNIKHLPFIICNRLFNFYEFLNTNYLLRYEGLLSKHLNDSFGKDLKVSKDKINEKNIIINWPIPKKFLLTVIIPTKDNLFILDKCIKSLTTNNPGCRLEIIIVNNNSINLETLKYLDKFKSTDYKNQSHKVLNYNKPFNYSKINNFAVQRSNGDTILLLNNDVEILTDNWGYFLSSNAFRDDIACVGAKLLFPDNTIQHAGVILGIGGVAGHSHKYYDCNSQGFNNRLNFNQEYSAVTAACMCISKAKWNLIGGLDEANLAVNYNDVDFCMRALEMNFKNLYLPYVVGIHHESKTRGKPMGRTYELWRKEYKFMKSKWSKHLLNDLYYSPFLTTLQEDWSISIRNKNLIIR